MSVTTPSSYREVLDAGIERILKSKHANEIFFHIQQMFYSDSFQELLEQANNDKDKQKELYAQVRDAFKPYYERGGILQHSMSKPYGYPGDYEILEHLYDKAIHAKTDPAYRSFDEYVHQLHLIQAVCQRKDILTQLLKELSTSKKSYCSIASGSAREVWEAKDYLEDCSVTLVDFDSRPLEFASKRLSNSKVKVETQTQDGRKLSLGTEYDVIYSFGFFDYLNNRFIDRILATAKDSLKEDGKIVYSFKNHERYEGWFYDMLCDWRFVPRNKADADQVAIRNGLEIEHCIPTENHAAYVYVCKIKDPD